MASSKKDQRETVLEQTHGPLIYVGPTMPGLAAQGQTFLSLPLALEEHIERCPSIRALLIPPSRWAQVRNSPQARICSERVRAYLNDNGR